ncbi:putative methyltransferase [Blastocystis sp. subtype 4]|uniref:putative methyltransferase n=1 Tax=Blastocystis sp. subtype 4 TaxID=944170 RepID=UPI00071225F6|nr:putative methyltransferase [Blastocystis sp. subtype 4]KNB42957.1 putative methyltransferase [Blastocystis sp. subtype 4]|eukprot:XP_014526400.1 putative methyltransferase [Blastocystis sp. subtype 4]
MTKKAQRTGDKWYKLAKQQGYRARSAFKLVQLNRQFNFLSKAHVLVDLCAAPGGWSQVAAKQMPVESTIIAVDLMPMKPIHNVKTFQEDITTQKCRNADVVLHDGAPNVGGGWDKDAFDQNSLVLHSLRLAVEFLAKGGVFVTKVFRSADYHALIYIFNQLFEKVQATKPAASRNESAEIFVVCLNYKAPSYIDPKLLNPDYAFKQVNKETTEVNLFNQKTARKRWRDGYDEDLGFSLRRVISVKDFMIRSDPIRVLTEAHELSFDEASQRFLENPLTTEEVKTCCGDLRVLNKGDFKMLLKWRLDMLKAEKEYIKELKHEDDEGEAKEKTEKEEVSKDVSAELQEVRERLALEKRREERKARKREAKERKRRLLGLDRTPIANFGEQVFSTADLNLKENEDLAEVNLNETEDPTMYLESEEEVPEEMDSDIDELELLQSQLDQLYDQYKERRTANEKKYLQELEKRKGLPAQKLREQNKLNELVEKETEVSKEAILQRMKEEEEELEDENESEEDESDESEESENDSEDSSNENTVPSELRRQRWFSDPMFADLSQSEESESDDEAAIAGMKQLQSIHTTNHLDEEEDEALLDEDKSEKSSYGMIADGEYVPPIIDIPKTDKEKRHEKRLKQMKKEERKKARDKKEDLQIVATDFPQAVVKPDKEPKIGSDEHLEQLSLGFLLSKHSTANDLIESSYNRYTYNDPDNLPDWFVENEKKYNRPVLPMTKEIMDRLRKQFNNDDRTIKKEREAMARKKRRVERLRKQQKAKIDSINNDEDMPDSAKLRAIQKIMKGKDLKHPGKVYVVGKKGENRRRGRNVKMKDKRAEKRIALRASGKLRRRKGRK